jgi:hypothetical protein
VSSFIPIPCKVSEEFALTNHIPYIELNLRTRILEKNCGSSHKNDIHIFTSWQLNVSSFIPIPCKVSRNSCSQICSLSAIACWHTFIPGVVKHRRLSLNKILSSSISAGVHFFLVDPTKQNKSNWMSSQSYQVDLLCFR